MERREPMTDTPDPRPESEPMKRPVSMWVMERLLLVCSVLLVAIGVGWWNEGPPLAVVERTLLTKEVRPGDLIRVHNIVRPHKRCPVKIERWLIDSSGNQYPVKSETRWPQVDNGIYRFETSVRVPKGIFAGPAEYHVAARWHCNLLQEYVRTPTFEFAPFEVIILPEEDGTQ